MLLALISILALAAGDTLRLEVGSSTVDGRVYQPHRARVRVHLDSTSAPVVAEWTNELTLGDSAGREVMRWVTRGTQMGAGGTRMTWEIFQTYDRKTLAPLGYARSSSAGGFMRLTIDGGRVKGTKRLPGDSTVQPVDLTVERMGFIASASDLVPLAVGLKEGAVMIAPVWGPEMAQSELRIFTVVGKAPTPVEGKVWDAWKVEERRHADGRLLAAWYLVDQSPYMVAGDVFMPDGRVRKMTEIALP